MFHEAGQLAYVIHIPFVEEMPYLRYDLKTWPVPIGNETRLAQLNIKSDIGYNTENGDITELVDCFGENPIVCPPTPLYDSTRLTCRRGLINQHPSDRKTCPLLYSEGNMATTFERYGQYWSTDEIALTCRGQSSRLDYLILPSTCTLTGHDWSIKGEVMVQPNISITTNLNIELDDDWLQDIIGKQFNDEPLDPALQYDLVDNKDNDDDIQNINDIINEIDQIKDNHDNLNDDVFVHYYRYYYDRNIMFSVY